MKSPPDDDLCGLTRDAPRVRRSARVLLLDADDRLLLFGINGGTWGPEPIWITPGGGLEAGESHEVAAERELWEETGLSAPPGPWVWSRQHVWSWRGSWIDSRERFYLTRSDVRAPQLEPGNLDPLEREELTTYRWWSLPELLSATRDGVLFAPRGIAGFLGPLINGELPGAPVDVGQ